MHETNAVSPEISTLLPWERRLLDALTLPDDITQQWRVQFEQEARQLIDRQPSPERQKIVEHGLSLVGWELFGRAGEPLPDSLATYYNPQTGITTVDYAPHIPYRETHGAGVRKYVLSNLHVTEEYRDFWDQSDRGAEVTENFAEVMRHGEWYGFLTSFEAHAVDNQEQPLTIEWRSMREAAIIDDVSKKGYRLQDVGHNPGIRLPLQQQMHRLEHETMLAREPAADQAEKAPERLNIWFLEQANRLRPSTVEPIVSIDHDSGRGLLLIRTQTGVVPTSIFAWSQLADVVTDSIIKSKPALLPFRFDMDTNLYIKRSLLRFYQGGASNVKGSLDTATAEAAKAETIVLVEQVGAYSQDNRTQYNSLLTCLRRPPGPLYIDEPSAEKVSVMLEDEPFKVVINDKEEYLEKLSRRIATVDYPGKRVTSGRILSFQNNFIDYPRNPVRYDLMIDFDAEPQRKSVGPIEPYIPGLRIIGRQGPRWFFELSAPDPYESATPQLMQLDRVRVRRLSSQYASIGLYDLATALQTDKVKSVADLLYYIGRNRVYTFDAAFPNARFDKVPEVAKFTPYVLDGRFHAQCTGADMFVQSSLMVALPECSTQSITGLLIENDIIRDVGHQQTLVRYKGMEAILDVGHAPLPGSLIQAIRIKRLIGSLLIKKPSVHSTVPEPIIRHIESQSMSQELYAEKRRAHFLYTKSQLERTLLTIFGVTDIDALYDKVVRLHADDPVRYTLCAFDAAEQGDLHALAKAYDYLEEYTKASQRIHADLQRSGFLPYDQARIDTLLASLREVVVT